MWSRVGRHEGCGHEDRIRLEKLIIFSMETFII